METRTPSFCAQCRSRCGCDAVVADGRLLRIEPRADHPSGEKLCPKGRASAELVHHPDRLTTPLRRITPKGEKPVRWQAITWDEALDEIAAKMGEIRNDEDGGAEQVAFSVTTPSGTHISDSIAWVERFIRAFGSPNTIYGTEICNWHKDFATRLTYGTDIGTPDFANSDCIILWGHNPSTTWLARSVELQKAMKRGAKLVVIDPRPTVHAKRADCWLPVRPGTDQVVALGLAHLLLSTDRIDADFVRRWSNAGLLVRDDTGAILRQGDIAKDGDPSLMLALGVDGDLITYDAGTRAWSDTAATPDLFAERIVTTRVGAIRCRTALNLFAEIAARFPPARVAEISGVSEDRLRAAADLIGQSKRVSYYAWNGVSQSASATQTDRAISILYTLTGDYGDKGGNVPGGAARFNDISGQDLLSDTQRAKALGLDARPLGPGRQGYVTARDVYRAVIDRQPYPVRMLVSFGGNLLSAQPDAELARAAFDALEMHVHADFFLNATAELADFVLPVATSWEREGLRTGFDVSLEGLRQVQLRPAAIAPIGEARSDTDIVLALSQRLGLSALMFDDDVDKGHQHQLAPSGIDLKTLRTRPEGITLDGAVPLRAYEAGGFPTPSGLVEIYSEPLHRHDQPALPHVANSPQAAANHLPLQLSSAKTVAYCHSQGRNIPALRRLHPDPVVEMSPVTAEEYGIAEGAWVEIETAAGSFRAVARLVRDLQPGTVFAQHGWTQNDVPSANMNASVPTDLADPVSGSIPLRNTPCQIRPAA